MQDDMAPEAGTAEAPVVAGSAYEAPAILWREKFPVKSVIAMSSVPGQPECGGTGTGAGYEGG